MDGKRFGFVFYYTLEGTTSYNKILIKYDSLHYQSLAFG
jgi:hypothetical protein